MYKITILPIAKNDLESISKYIILVLNNSIAAKNLLVSFDKCLENVRLFPYGESKIYSNKKVINKYRIAKFSNYNLFYIVDDNKEEILVVRILYKRMNFSNYLE